MATESAPQLPMTSLQMASMLRDLRNDTILLALPGAYVAGIALIFTSSHTKDPLLQAGLPALILFLIPPGVWAVRRLSYLAAAWLFVAGCLLVDLMLVTWGQMAPALALLGLPVALGALFVGLPAGALTATACTTLLFAPPALRAFDVSLRIVALTAMWGTFGLICLTERPLLTTVEWCWSGWERSHDLLERARDFQVQLKQTLADLADANLQLTRLNRLADGLRQAAEDARRAKEQFVANVSHELRTPLNMIVGFVEMIVQVPELYGRQLPPTLLADLAVVLQNSQHLSSLIDDVLDLSQVEAGRMALVKERAALAEIVDAAVLAVRPLYDSKGLYLEAEVAADLELFCDPTRVRQVVLNLLSNAGRFTEAGGVRIRAWREGGEVVVSVADTGPGIAAEDVERLFQPFQQLDASLRRRHGGSGLGLSISKRFVELHGGRMWLESEPGAGTVFYFRLPIELPTRPGASAARWLDPSWEFRQRTHRSLAPTPVVRPRWVVLESGNALQRLLGRYLSQVELAPAPDLDGALQELSRLPAQALVVNGASVPEELQGLPPGALPPGTPAIVCAVPGAREVAGALGVAAYLVKPVSRESLLHTLQQLRIRRGTILIVDDDPEAQRLFRRMLASSKRRYRALRADDGQQALDILRQERPAAILLDLVMPDMDGFQFLAAKDGDPALRDIPVVVLSARDPGGQPIVSPALAVTQNGGLSAPQLLDCMVALSRILAPGGLVESKDSEALCST